MKTKSLKTQIIIIGILTTNFNSYSQVARAASIEASDMIRFYSKTLDVIYINTVSSIDESFNIIKTSNEVFSSISDVKDVYNNDLRYQSYVRRRENINNLEKEALIEYTKALTEESILLGREYANKANQKLQKVQNYAVQRAKEELLIIKEISDYMKRILNLKKDIKNIKENFNRNLKNIESTKKRFETNVKRTKEAIENIITVTNIALKAQETAIATPVGGIPSSDLILKDSQELDKAIERVNKAMDNAQKEADERASKINQETMIKTANATAKSSEINKRYASYQVEQETIQGFYQNLEYYNSRLNNAKNNIQKIQRETIIIKKRTAAKKLYYKRLVIEELMEQDVYDAFTNKR